MEPGSQLTLVLNENKLKGRGHNRLMSKFGPFFIFGQICVILGM